jgi:hypothetical protein
MILPLPKGEGRGEGEMDATYWKSILYESDAG